MNRPAETEHVTPFGTTVYIEDKGLDRTASKWFKGALANSLGRDPVEASHDAKALAEFLAWRVQAIARAVMRAEHPGCSCQKCIGAVSLDS